MNVCKLIYNNSDYKNNSIDRLVKKNKRRIKELLQH